MNVLNHDDLVSAMADLGIEINRQGYACCPLPAHADKTPSFRVRVGSMDGTLQWKCYGCGQGGGYAALCKLLGRRSNSSYHPDNAPRTPTIAPERLSAIEAYIALSGEYEAAGGLKRLPVGLRDRVKEFFSRQGMASVLQWYDFVATGIEVSTSIWHFNMLRCDSFSGDRALIEPVNAIADPSVLAEGFGIDYQTNDSGFLRQAAAIAAGRIRARRAGIA